MNTERPHDRRPTTPENQARARRLSRMANLAAVMGLVGVTSPFVALALAVSGVVGDAYALPFLGWTTATAVLLLVCAVLVEIHVEGLLREARFADAHKAIGMVDEVIEDGHTEVQGPDMLLISAAIPGTEVTIRRRVTCPSSTPGSGRSWVGQSLIFRHTNLDPDDLDDILIAKWPRKAPG